MKELPNGEMILLLQIQEAEGNTVNDGVPQG